MNLNTDRLKFLGLQVKFPECLPLGSPEGVGNSGWLLFVGYAADQSILYDREFSRDIVKNKRTL